MIKKIINRYISMPSKDVTVLNNVAASFLTRGGALIISLFSTPAFIAYFNNEAVLGVWYTILSVITWILNFDLGIGNGLRNHLAASLAIGDEKRSKELISSSYFIIAIVVSVILFAGYIVLPHINWNSFFGVAESVVSSEIMVTVVRCVFTGIMLQFFLRLISSILYAMQRSAINNIISLLISIVQLLFVLVVPVMSTEEKLILLSYAYIAIIAIPYLVVTMILFSTKLKSIRPSFSCINKCSIRQVMGVGGTIFLCQILYMALINTNNFFISHYTGSENVVDYEIYHKLFSLVGTLASLVLTPLWSMVTKAISEKDYKWVQNIYHKSLVLVGITAAGQFAMILLLKPIIRLWIGESVLNVSYLYGLIFAIWGSVFTYHNVLSTFACGMSKMKTQMVCYTGGIIAKLVFLFYMFRVSDSWIFVVISNIIVFVPYCIAQHIVFRKQLTNR